MAAAGAPASTGGALQQDQEVGVELSRTDRSLIPIAVLPLDVEGDASAEARMLYDVLLEDLRNSMVFDVADSSSYPPLRPNGEIPWEAWQQTPTDVVISGVVRRDADALIADFRLFAVENGRQVTGRRYRQPLESARRIAHKFNDEAVLHYTGTRGAADTLIAFVSDRESAFPEKELFIMESDGEHQGRITGDRSLALSPSFSPQGDRLVYQTYRRRDGFPRTELFLVFQSGGQPRQVVGCNGTTTGPAFSPDGTQIAYASSCAGNADVYLVRPDGSEQTRITNNSAGDMSPDWSPNSRQIVFMSDRAGSQQLYVMDATGLNVRRLSVPGGQKADPVWQPVEGNYISYTASTGGGNFDIFLYDLRTNSTSQITRGSGKKEGPAWSPDGRQLVFEWKRGERTQIWAMGLDGTRQRVLTSIGNNETPSWGIRP